MTADREDKVAVDPKILSAEHSPELRPLRGGIKSFSDLKMNTIALYGNFVIVAVIGVIFSPMLVRLLGQEQFGIWKGSLRLLDLTAVADGRATQALKWVVAHDDSREDTANKQRMIGASLLVWCIWLPILLGGLTLVVVGLPSFIGGISERNLPIARLAVMILGANMVMTALLGIPDALLVGTNQGWRSYLLTTFYLVLSNVGMVIAGYLGFGIIGVAASTMIFSVLNGVSTYFVARARIPWLGVKLPSIKQLKQLLNFSNLTMVWMIVRMVMLASDVLLIGYFSGAQLVSRYTFFAYVTQFALSICLMTSSAAAPKLGSLIGSGQMAEAAARLKQLRAMLFCTIIVLAGGIILCNQAFVSLWIGPQFYLGDPANLMMVAVLVQLALIRFEGQIQDVSLTIGKKVLWGAIFTALSFALAAAFYSATGSLAMMFTGLLLGRLPLNFVFAMLVHRMVPGGGYDLRGHTIMIASLCFLSALSLVWKPEGLLSFLLTAPLLAGFLIVSSGLMLLPQKTLLAVVNGILERLGRKPIEVERTKFLMP